MKRNPVNTIMTVSTLVHQTILSHTGKNQMYRKSHRSLCIGFLCLCTLVHVCVTCRSKHQSHNNEHNWNVSKIERKFCAFWHGLFYLANNIRPCRCQQHWFVLVLPLLMMLTEQFMCWLRILNRNCAGSSCLCLVPVPNAWWLCIYYIDFWTDMVII
jgi:hypothetical protein